jgi:proteasome lid subunit RPN8/RPN11
MKWISLWFLFAFNYCTAPIYAADLPTSRQEETIPYQTLDQAAKAALNVAMPLSKADQTEYGGIIVELNGAFFYTSAVTTSESTALNFKAAFKHGAHFVGLYHTHPGNLDCSNYFSAPDVEIAEKFDITSYIGVVGPNTIRRFIAGKTKKTQPIMALHQFIADGVIIS